MAQTYAAFEVAVVNTATAAKTPVANTAVAVYRLSDNSLLTTVTSNADGVVLPFTIASVPALTPIYYVATITGINYRGGQFTSEYQDVFVIDNPDTPIYPQVRNQEAANLEIWVKRVADGENAFVRIANPPAQSTENLIIPNTYTDAPALIFAVISIAADGVRSHSRPEDAPQVTLTNASLTAACIIAQITNATETDIQFAVADFPLNAVARQVQIADDVAFTVGAVTVLSTGTAATSTSLFVSRASVPGQAAATKSVRVRHSTVSTSGPWGAWSNTETFTFASNAGTGGSTGDGGYNPWGGGDYNL